MRRLVRLLGTIAALTGMAAAPPGPKPGPLDEEIQLRPGLLAEYRSMAPGAASVVRIDAKPAFTWGDSSPHPRIGPGPFEVTWSGVLHLRDPHPVRIGAYVGGEVTVTIDGAVALQGRGRKETAWIDAAAPLTRKPGMYRIRIHYRSLAGVPARIQLWWESKGFAREPLAAAWLTHVPAELPAAAQEESLAARGREAVGRLGCARCHAKAFPGVSDPPPGPSLAELATRVKYDWLVGWLGDPAKLRHGARMPRLFSDDRRGLAERSLVAEYLLKATAKAPRDDRPGDYRSGRQAFLGLGCLACHLDPEKPPAASADPERHLLSGLQERMTAGYLAAFVHDPASRYPDGRMPKLPVPADTARHIATYLLKESKTPPAGPAVQAAKDEEVAAVLRRLKVTDRQAAGAALVQEKGCVRCHTGIGEPASAAVAIREPAGCLTGKGAAPRFALDDPTRRVIAAYLKLAGREANPSAFEARQRTLRHLGCHRCHQRDGDRASPLEEISRTIWAPFIYRLPYQRTPRLTQATTKFRREYLLSAVRDGVSGLRPDWYSYRMPSFGEHATGVVRALAEGDGDLPSDRDTPTVPSADPTLTALGPTLVGFEGYSCVSCHVWAGKTFAAV